MKKRSSPIFIIALSLIIIASAILCIMLIFNGGYVSGACAGVIAICSITLLIVSFVYDRNVIKYATAIDKDIVAISRQAFYDYPEPIIIVDSDENVIWYNASFEANIFDEDRAYGIHLSELVGNNTSKVYTLSGAIVKILDRYYRVTARKSDVFDLSVISFVDETDHVMLEDEFKKSHKTVLIMTVDNYDDVLQNSKESGKAHVQVQIERMFEHFIENTNGVIHKISNDRFFAIIEDRHLGPIIERRFDILDEARSISIGERSNVTLSIGVGRGAKTLAESESFAKQALDMCLGRGGDQAAVKTENGFEFFGGISKAVEKSTKVKSRIIARALKELAESSDTVFIMGHRLADFDAVGSAVGLCGAFRSMGKNAYVAIDKDKNLSKALINYISMNCGSDYFKSLDEALFEINDRSLLIVVDTHNPEIVDSKELYEAARQVVVIDHHRKMVNHIDNAVVFFHEPFASSTCEMAAELIQYFGTDCKISISEAEALLAGIMLDTKNFVMRSNARTFEAAAYLKKLGADTIVVKSFFSDSLETYREKSVLIQSAKIFHGCAIAVTESISPELRLAAPQAADELLGISGVKASFVIYRMDGTCFISARSMGAFNVQLIMETIGGGGHQTMAGAQLEISLNEAEAKVKDAIEDFLVKS